MGQGRAGGVAEPTTGPRLRPGAGQLDTIIEIATWFYVHGWSQVRIARALDLDPSTVSRYLKRARDEAIVRIEIRRPADPDVHLARRLTEHVGISRSIVVAEAAAEDPLEAVAAAAAEHVEGLLGTGMRLGVSWGQTLAALVRHLRPGAVSRLTIAQLAGGLDESSPGIQGHELVRALGSVYPASRLRYLHAPAVVDNPQIRAAIMADHGVAAALEDAAASEVALVGIGSMDVGATLVLGGHVSPEDRRRLIDLGAVGNMNTRFFDVHGRPVGDLDARTIAISWTALRSIPTVIAVAVGQHKLPAVWSALRSGCIDVLVTDETMARGLLAMPAVTSPAADPEPAGAVPAEIGRSRVTDRS
jgi:DNA-binding transcriptional regulator LsrR (DeoR family)